ncbi:MAG: class I SAM-dependent methyltransferase [Spirochaetales bacterium]|nr:class I SAM-dependent methyltransferase [Spirochaetales bacterium]
MDELFLYLENLIEKGGPDPADYKRLDNWVHKVISRRRSGSYGEREMNALRRLWGRGLSPDTCQGIAYLKPRGYAGDFEILDKLYSEYVSPDEHYAKWDRYSHHHPAVRAVRNRPPYLKKLVLANLPRKRTLHVLNVGSGPGRDLAYFFENVRLNGGHVPHFHCLEQDNQAIAHARALCRDYKSYLSFIKGNILRFPLPRKYDVIWASGIFDYFNDRIFLRILKKLLAALDEGGECVVGNLAADNPSKSYLEILEWHIHHRSPRELRQLARLAGVSPRKMTVGRDKTGANLFLHVKQG